MSQRRTSCFVLALGLAAGSCAERASDAGGRVAHARDERRSDEDGNDLGLTTVRRPRPGAEPSVAEVQEPELTDLSAESSADIEEVELDLPRERRPRPEPTEQVEPTAPERPASAAPREQLDSTEISRPLTVDRVRVLVGRQELELWAGDVCVRRYPVSTAKNGVGSAAGSQRTPLGRHRVHAKFGTGEPVGRVFESRRPTAQVARIHTDPVDLPEDVITTRILWLEGLEPGRNRGKGVDSKDRYIYIHGTNEEGLIGTPASHGCVRMRNADVLEVFEVVAEGTTVEIVE